ncbi:APC family permease [Haloarcula litorea]|uniref:APC family permease n=1 Tax=Haloarcula litorea TaxID=3032579 RepID=UPI0023E8C292|nr:APC family permease [Halomicroarcula sp. GDY20]
MSDDDQLGVFGASAIALGGMIGGGVFAVLGVVARITGASAWAAFALASTVSMAAAYSYLQLNKLSDDHGGSVTFIENFVGRPKLAGVVGWTLLVGYIGAMAMYAFAFGSFFEKLFDVTTVPLLGLPVRPFVSVAAIGLFVGLNLLGARSTGRSEIALVALKVAILVVFGGWGVVYGFQVNSLEFGLSPSPGTGLLMATAISFVSFQGWQLLMYDQEQIKDPESTLPIAVYVSLVATVLIDGLVAVVTTSLAPQEVIAQHPETALAVAARPFIPGDWGFVAISIAALFSTGSAINGTLFSSAHFGKGMLSDDLLPDRIGDGDADGVPERTIVVLGVLAAAFTAYGSLQGITSFGSLAFIAVFGAMSYVGWTQRDAEEINGLVPAFGVVGSAAFFPILLYHLFIHQRNTFFTVLLIAAAVLAIELLYFKRESVLEGVQTVEKAV